MKGIVSQAREFGQFVFPRTGATVIDGRVVVPRQQEMKLGVAVDFFLLMGKRLVSGYLHFAPSDMIEGSFTCYPDQFRPHSRLSWWLTVGIKVLEVNPGQLLTVPHSWFLGADQTVTMSVL